MKISKRIQATIWQAFVPRLYISSGSPHEIEPLACVHVCEI